MKVFVDTSALYAFWTRATPTTGPPMRLLPGFRVRNW
jgi:hypothetical protein